MKILVLILRVLVCVLTGPLWVVGFAATSILSVAEWVVRWAFWEPCSRSWYAFIGSWRALQSGQAMKTPELAEEAERIRKGKDFARRVRRVTRVR